MPGQKNIDRMTAVVLAVLVVSGAFVRADIINGRFDAEPLGAGWMVPADYYDTGNPDAEPGVYYAYDGGQGAWAEIVRFDGDTAILTESPVFDKADPVYEGAVSYTGIEQSFGLPVAGSAVLSFDFWLEGHSDETDYFVVQLNGTPIEIASTSTGDSWRVDSGYELLARPGEWYRATLGFSASPLNTLQFQLVGKDEGEVPDAQATVHVDNVSVVPVPGTLLLGVVGLGAAGCQLRRRRI
ncbi:MAG: hypothetical protein MUC88_19455 [Planctomycetes bacterium]|jgi:hypothetical protein|nr:hypothetical protein [Planctomycetota bacterium]